jgi:hypothetical protein
VKLLSYVVTTIGLPLAILVFIYEQKKERDNGTRRSISCCPTTTRIF